MSRHHQQLLKLAAEAVGRIREVQAASNAVSPEGEGRGNLEQSIEDAAALADDLQQECERHGVTFL